MWVRRSLVGALALAVTAAAAVAGPSSLAHAATSRTAAALPACTATHWVSSWGASPSDASTGLDASLKTVTFGVDQSMRMVLTPHLAGQVIRLQLSNRFGSKPVTFTAVDIADQQSGASVVPGSSTRVTFNGGASSVTVPAGADTLSDPVTFSVTPFANLAVSLFLQDAPGSPTEHYTARQTSYLTPPLGGNHVADSSGSAYSQSTTARYYVSRLDVEATDRVGAVVTFGDSLTDGFQGSSSEYPEVQSTLNLNDRYPDFLQRRIAAAGIPLSVVNAGISGNRLLSGAFLATSGASGLSRFQADALDVPGVSDVILLEGINDIGLGSSVTAQQLINGYEQAITLAHAAGVKIQLGTLTPDGSYSQEGYNDAAAQSLRSAVNGWIRTQKLSDGYVDFDAAVRNPTDPNDIAAADDGGDGLHMSPAGYQAMANAVPLGDLARPACATPVKKKPVKKKPVKKKPVKKPVTKTSA